MLNFILLAACISVVVALVLYLFYWNRFIAYIIGLFLRLMYWNQGVSSQWVEMSSIQFSLLAGRIIFKDFRYHDSNQTVKAVKGQITWRYWIRKPTTEEDVSHTRVGSETQQAALHAHLCRLQVSLQGFEFFLYNRTASYDSIIAEYEPSHPSSAAENNDEHSDLPVPSPNPDPQTASRLPHFPLSSFFRCIKFPLAISSFMSRIKRLLPSLDLKDHFPIGIEIVKGALIYGNLSTPNLLAIEFQRAEGTFGIVQSRSKHDLYKQILSLKVQHVLARYVRNEDYECSMVVAGEMVEDVTKTMKPDLWTSPDTSFQAFAKFWRCLGNLSLKQMNHDPWLSRNMPVHENDEDTPTNVEFSPLEYAIECKLLETPMLDLSYYADVPGEVPQVNRLNVSAFEPLDIGNGDIPPEWGIDIVIWGGFLRYGPWADRQRALLQRTFFPPAYRNVVPQSYLKPGDKRLWTAFKTFVELRDDTTLHIPFREASKDWQWDGQVDFPHPRKRDPASIHITAGDRSSISYIMAMVPGPAGFEPVVEIHLDTVAVTSSLNDIRLVTAESCRIRCELPSPLQWNSDRTWTFAVSLRQPVLYLIRDHINMLTDLGRDWTSGPPTDYVRFIPTLYLFQLVMHHFELNLYANDHNIIDKPLVKDENALLNFHASSFHHETRIPATEFRPESTIIPFFIEVPDLTFNLSLPRWNTHALHAPRQGNNLGTAGFFRLDASYRYFAEVREEHVEHLTLDFATRDVALKTLGWSIRYFMVLRDNYFGSFTHFSTLNEYLEKRKKGLPVGDPIAQKYRPGKTNVLQVELGVSVANALLVLPAGLPGYESSNYGRTGDSIGACVMLTIPEVQVQLRLHDYFMEMSLNIDSASGSFESDCPEKVVTNHTNKKAKEVILIDGIDINANRLFGPRPRTATFMCIWIIRLGRINALLTASDAAIFWAACNAFRLNFGDSSNAPAAHYMLPLDPDVTFFKFSLDALDGTWLAGQAAVELSLPQGLRYETNDLGSRFHRKLASVRLPLANAKVFLAAARSRQTWLEAAECVIDAYLDVYSSPPGWVDKSRAQSEFIHAQSAPTGRAERVLEAFYADYMPFDRSLHRNSLYLPQPRLSNYTGHRKLHLRTSMPAVHPTERMAAKSTKSRRRSDLSHLTESEGEEGVSEADRDARLATTRSITPAPSSLVDDENQNMSSGDESDDEDLTDADSFGSELSELLHDSSANANLPLLITYGRSTRKYTAPSLKVPSLWDGSPFRLTRDISLSPAMVPGRSNFAFPPTTPAFDNALPSIIFRFECRQGLQARISPLILPVAAELMGAIETNVLSPELSLDAILTNYLGTFKARKKYQRRTTLEIVMSSIHLYLVHHIPTIDTEPIPLTFKDPLPGVMATVSILSDGWHLVCNSMDQNSPTPGEWTFSTSMDNLSVLLDTTCDRSLPHHGTTTNVFRLDCVKLCGNYERNRLGITCDATSIDLDHVGPELTTATGLALARSAADLLHFSKSFILHGTSRKQRVLYNILMSSRFENVVDPLSTIQPSYLVQSGLPHQLRTDATFRFLFHLRNCLWHLTGQERHVCSESIDHGIHEDTAALLESRLMTLSLDVDPPNIADMAALGIASPSMGTRGVQQKNLGQLFQSVSIKIRRTAVMVRDPLSISFSEFTLTSLSCFVCLGASELTRSHPVLSQTSLRQAEQEATQRLVVSLSGGDIILSISPHLMRFAQDVLRVQRRYAQKSSQASDKNALSMVADGQFGLYITSSFHCLRIQAAAENLIFEFGITGMHVASTLMFKPGTTSQGRIGPSTSISTLFDESCLRALSPGTGRRNDHDTLACFSCGGGKVTVIDRQDLASNFPLQLVLSMENALLSVPRSALRLYRFIEEWRADFLPGIEATLHELLSEFQKSPTKAISSKPRSTVGSPGIRVHGSVSKFGVSLQVMHGTWFTWDVYQTVAYLDPLFTSRNLKHDFGIQLSSQSFRISSKASSSHSAPNIHLKLDLPTLSVTGYYDGLCVQTMCLVDFFHFKVKPSHWDTLLVVQQKFGQDFQDLMTLVEETRRRRRSSLSDRTPPTPRSTDQPWKLSGYLKMRGFRIGLEVVSSTLYLECRDIRGGVAPDADRIWNVRFSDLGLSLASYTSLHSQPSILNRGHRSAFVVIDFQTSGGHTGPNNQVLQVLVTKIHAIMQPSSIGEVGDFIDHMQAEILERKEQRAIELAGFREKTKSVMKTFEISAKDSQFRESSSLLIQYTINLSIRNIGVAFPLSLDQDLRLPQRSYPDSSDVRAFLFSIKSLDFGSHRGESGQAVMHDFSFQFVPRFQQSNPADFSGANHQTRNRLLYPEMTAHVRSYRSPTSRQVRVEASVSGFVLDLDSTIPDYVFSLIDVYRQGKDRVARFAAHIPRKPSSVGTTPQNRAEDVEKQYTRLPTSSVVASLTFLSGRVRMYSSAVLAMSKSRSIQSTFHEPLDDQLLDFGGDTFELPVISLWGEYHATPASNKLGINGEAEPSVLMFKSTVHSSENSLRPTLLPFLTELVNHVDTRLREDNWRKSLSQTSMTTLSTALDDSGHQAAVSTLQINFSLRIDQSKLELTCQPDVNVIAGLHWDSGGFVVNVSPGARKVAISGSVGGLTVGLKHGFLSEDCLRLDARNLAFSVTFGNLESNSSSSISSVSLVVDTEFSGGMKFSRLQDVLCFKAVWLDRIPIFTGQDTVVAKSSPKPTPPVSSVKSEFATVFLMRIRQIRLDIDLGQSISAVTLELKDALLRTNLTAVLNEVSLSVADAVIVAKGNVSGSASVPNFVFQTIRRMERKPVTSSGQPRLLELTMTSGALNLILESEHQKLVQYRAEPLEIEIFDDWSMIASAVSNDGRPLRLSFVVTGSEVVAVVTIRTVPKLLFYATKFKANLESQREGASRESRAFRSTHSPKPDNPLSAVANAMLHSARSRFKEAESSLSYVIRQRMSLRLNELRLAVFPRTMADLEIAQFIGRDVHARLDRLVEPDGRTTQRNLHLSFSSMVISKFSQLNHSGTGTSSPSDGKMWLTLLLRNALEAIIVGLPHMHMHMVSEQSARDPTQTLLYDFHSRFIRREGMKDREDIYITLNMALYSWLTFLRKNLSREMDQVKASADWRATNMGLHSRKRIPDPLLFTTSPISGHNSNTPPSTLLSPTAIVRSHSMEQSKSASAAYHSFDISGKDMYLQPSPHSKSTDTLSSPHLYIPFSIPNKTLTTEGPLSPGLSPATSTTKQTGGASSIVYRPRSRHIERLTMRQLGEATPDVMHPFFMKKAGFNLEDALPQYVHEYATIPLEEIMEALLKLYSNQLQRGYTRTQM